VSARALVFVVGVGVVGYLIYQQMSSGGSSENPLEDAAEDVEAAVNGWAQVNEGPTWVPVINQAEAAAGIPTNLLARMAYEESRFRPDVITGETASTAGALGILQLEPEYFSTVQVPVPFSTADTQAQITQAAQQLASLYAAFNDWGYAVAAYNCGETCMKNVLAGSQAMPSETSAYVSDILTDVPVASQLNA
jgi:soluble lytic murein transglycosylase-like protein